MASYTIRVSNYTDPIETAVANLKSALKPPQDTYGKVATTILDVTEYTHYSDVAEIAECSENTAKKHLDRLAQVGMAEKRPKSRLAVYRRNSAYLEGWRAWELSQKKSQEELEERVRELEKAQWGFRERYLQEQPDELPMTAEDVDEETSDRMNGMEEWNRLLRQIQVHELAHYITQNDGHLLR